MRRLLKPKATTAQACGLAPPYLQPRKEIQVPRPRRQKKPRAGGLLDFPISLIPGMQWFFSTLGRDLG